MSKTGAKEMMHLLSDFEKDLEELNAKVTEYQNKGYGGVDEVDQVMRWFVYGHLANWLKPISGSVQALAHVMARDYAKDKCPELLEGLRHLLIAKDCFVRTAINHKMIEDEMKEFEKEKQDVVPSK